MAKVTPVTLPIEADPSQVIQVIDVVVKHLTALRDDLAALSGGKRPVEDEPCRDPSCGLVFAHPASRHPKLAMLWRRRRSR